MRFSMQVFANLHRPILQITIVLAASAGLECERFVSLKSRVSCSPSRVGGSHYKVLDWYQHRCRCTSVLYQQ